MQKQITLGQLLKASQDALRNSMSHMMPGRVVSYDSGQQTATIQPMINDVRKDLELGALIYEPYQAVQGVPVAFPRGGGFVVSWPLVKYDPVLLLAFDLDPTPFRTAEKSLQPVNPVDALRHGGTYWVAYPCDVTLNPPQSAGAAGSGLVIGQDGGPALIQITDGEIQLGSSASEPVALSTLVDSLIDVLVATYTAAGPETGFAAFIAALQAWKTTNWGGGTVGSSLVKANT